MEELDYSEGAFATLATVNLSKVSSWDFNMSKEDDMSFCNDTAVPTESEWTVGQMVWTSLFTVILVTAMLGNSIVIWIILAHRSMWSVTNYFLFNLTVADLLMASLNCLPSFIFMRDRVWKFGSVYCKVNTFISHLTVTASVLTLLALTVDRRKAIMKPLAPKASKCRVLLTILGIWLVSCIIALPTFIFSKEFKISKCSSATACNLIWPDSDVVTGASTYDYVYNLVFFLATYLLPMAGMAVCYLQMGRTLWGAQVIGEDSSHPAITKSIQNKKRVVMMFSVVISIFMVCWLPYHVYFLFTYHFPEITKMSFTGNMYLSFYWLAMANSCVNPIIYYWMNSRFRKFFNTVFMFIPNTIFKLWKNDQRNCSNMAQNSNNLGLQGHARYKQTTILSQPHEPHKGDEIPLRLIKMPLEAVHGDKESVGVRRMLHPHQQQHLC